MFNAYQQAHWRRTEKALTKAHYVVSCIGHKPGRAVFVGIYRVAGWKPVSIEEFWTMPGNMELKELGMTGLNDDRPSTLWFDLQLTEELQHWKGKLILEWSGLERSWYRWAANNKFPVKAILLESALEPEMEPWDKLILTRDELKSLLPTWRSAFSHWRGIYLIFDVSDGKGYVGSAYGQENLLNRWLNYAVTGHGGNKQLRSRSPENFRFSILQRVSPDMDPDQVIQLEASWKERLHTRTFGLNDN